MGCVECSLLMTLLSLLWTVLFVRADLTIKVSEDKCDRVYDLHNEINIVYRSYENSLKKDSRCLLTVKSGLANREICIRPNAVKKDNRFCNIIMYTHFGSEKPKPYDLKPFNCDEREPTCTNYNQLYMLFKYSAVVTIANITLDLTIYLQEITTTTERATTTYKSSKGKFDPVASLLIPIGIVAGVCGATCLVICCVVCARCCKDDDTAASTENNEEPHELNDQSLVVPSAPEVGFNQIPQQTDHNIPYNYADDPPGYDQALLAEYPAKTPTIPPPPYSSV